MAAWLLGVFVLVLLAGLALIRLGWRGRRVNRDPVCRDCGFNLRAFRLPEMHGVAEPLLTVAPATQSELADVAETHSLTLGARQGGGALSGEGSSSVAVVLPITVTCPECGGGLKRAKAVRIGERKRSLLVVAAGVAAVVLGMTPLSFASFFGVTGKDYSGYLPVGLLIFQSRHTTSETSRKIAAELEKRLLAKTMDLGQKRLIVDRALEIQADWSTPWAEEWGSVIEAARLSGAIESDQSKRYLSNIARFELFARKDVRPGDPLPVGVKVGESRVAANSQFFLRAKVKEAFLADMSLLEKGVSLGRMQDDWRPSEVSMQVMGSVRSSGFPTTPLNAFAGLRVPTGLDPGRHRLRLVLELEASAAGGQVRSQTRELWCDIAVTDSTSAGVTPIDPTPELEQSFRRLLDCSKVRWMASPNYNVVNGKQVPDPQNIHWYLEFGSDWKFRPSSLPAQVCMKVIGYDAGGQEIVLGSLSSEPWSLDSSASSTTGLRRSYFGVDQPRPLSNIVLRPDLEGAKASFTLTRVYAGELRFDVVNVEYSESSNRRTYATKEAILEAIQKAATE